MPGVCDLKPSASAQQNAYGVALSVDGWANLCRFPEMALFVAGSKDSARCSYSNPAGYLQGCAAGFYQPGMDAQHTARPCPDGFFCPANFACTVITQCVSFVCSVEQKDILLRALVVHVSL